MISPTNQVRDSDAQLETINNNAPGETAKEISKCRLIVMYTGTVVAMAGALASIFVALTISMGIDDELQYYWALNFIKSLVQDLFVSPMVAVSLNIILIKFVVKNLKVRKIIRKTTSNSVNEHILKLTMIFHHYDTKLRSPPKVNVKNHSLIS